MRRVVILIVAGAANADAQTAPPDYGFNFITIGDVGNAAYDGLDLGSTVTGRGSVGYEYRIAKTELRTSQFVDFMSVLGTIDPDFVQINAPLEWGAVGSFQPEGSIRFQLISEEAGNWPVSGFSWRVAAMYTNWLHNDKAQTLAAVSNGAYDISTFVSNPDGPGFLDQTSRNPDAKYWIPSFDEWLKAAHYDPDKAGPGEGGWWQFPNGTDEPLTPGLPGELGAQTSYGVDLGGEEWQIPIGAYPDVKSPWGLLDVSGGAAEWTETWSNERNSSRLWGGSFAGPRLFDDLGVDQDVLWRTGANGPNFTFQDIGLRLASSVPSPGVGTTLIACSLLASVRRRRQRGGTLPPHWRK